MRSALQGSTHSSHATRTRRASEGSTASLAGASGSCGSPIMHPAIDRGDDSKNGRSCLDVPSTSPSRHPLCATAVAPSASGGILRRRLNPKRRCLRPGRGNPLRRRAGPAAVDAKFAAQPARLKKMKYSSNRLATSHRVRLRSSHETRNDTVAPTAPGAARSRAEACRRCSHTAPVNGTIFLPDPICVPSPRTPDRSPRFRF